MGRAAKTRKRSHSLDPQPFPRPAEKDAPPRQQALLPLYHSVILSYNMMVGAHRQKGSSVPMSSMSPPPDARDHTGFAIERIAAPVREQVEQRLRQAITSGHFRPGDRLIERELCTLRVVRRTSLREALRQLEGEGFVT